MEDSVPQPADLTVLKATVAVVLTETVNPVRTVAVEEEVVDARVRLVFLACEAAAAAVVVAPIAYSDFDQEDAEIALSDDPCFHPSVGLFLSPFPDHVLEGY